MHLVVVDHDLNVLINSRHINDVDAGLGIQATTTHMEI